MLFLRSTFVPFLVGVILTSVILVFIRPKQIGTPDASSSSVPGESESLTERARCEKVLGLFSVPLLGPPTLHPSIPSPIITNFEGDAYLKWLTVPNAKDYLVLVTDDEGKELKTYRTLKTGTYLNGLPRPKTKDSEKYLVKIASVNANDLIGDFSPPRELIVKKPMNLTAPKIKEIRIED